MLSTFRAQERASQFRLPLNACHAGWARIGQIIINKKIKEAYKDKSWNNKIKGYDQSKVQIEKTDEEDDENHTCYCSLCLTPSNPTKLYEKG